MVIPKGYQEAIQILWAGRAAITVWEGVLDERTGRTEPVERVTVSGLPCRLSFSTASSTQADAEAAGVAQAVTLYTAPDVEIPEGSKVTVTQNGVTQDYARSGTSAVYTHHQEVPLELFRRWA